MPQPQTPVTPARWPVAPTPSYAGWTPPAKPAATKPATAKATAPPRPKR